MFSAYYPLLIAIGGLVVSALLSERALVLMPPDAKVALMDSFARTRIFNLLVIVLCVPLIFWRPVFAWMFLGCSFLGLGVRSFFRLRRLSLPATASRLLLAGQTIAVAGIVVCALIFTLRALP